MVTSSIIIVSLIGFIFLNLISVKFKPTEKIGLSFPIGIALETMLMLIMDLTGIKLSPSNLIISECLFLLCLGVPFYFKAKDFKDETILQFKSFSITGYNLVWLFFIIALIYVEYMNFSKCMFWPPFDRDSLTSFDTIGYVAGMEHTYKGASIFNENYILNVRKIGGTLTYAPFVQLCYALVYSLGATTSKIIPGLFMLFFVIAYYGAVKRIANRTLSAIVTLLMLLTPEMLAFSSLSGVNVIQAIFASLGLIYIAIWFKQKDNKDLILGSILLGINMWSRDEGIVFIGAALAVLFINAIINKQFKQLIISTAISLLPAILWFIYMQICNFKAEDNIIITKLFWDGNKAHTIWVYTVALFKNTTYYGWAFYAFAISLILNIWFLIKKKDNLIILSLIVLSMLFYLIVLYQVDYVWDSMTNVLKYSAKRFFFCFIPVLWYYTATNKIVSTVFNKIEDLLRLK